jgi:hypothetical protein
VRVRFKITSALLTSIRADLCRPHAFAYERVGFIVAGAATSASAVLVLAQDYWSIADDDYLLDRSVGAMMGSEAIRKAMELALMTQRSIFHVHSHGGTGVPRFSPVDVRENAKFVPDFLKVAPQMIHGAIVLSDDAATGRFWAYGNAVAKPLSEVIEVGAPMRTWVSS